MAAAPDGQLIGRDAELMLIHEMVASARAGSGRSMLLMGDAGAGKSSLARHAVMIAKDQSVATRFGRSVQLDIGRPFATILDALGVRARDLLTSESSPVRTVLEAGATGAATFLVVERLAELVENLALEAPMLLVAEDLHWADIGTLQVMRLLIERAGDLPIAVLATARPARAGGLVPLLLDALPSVNVHWLPPLDDPAVSELVEYAFGHAPSPSLMAVLGQAGGNPLLVLAMIEAIEASGGMRRASDGDSLELIGEVDTLRPGAVITSRIAELDADVLRVLQTACLLGARIEMPMLAAVLDRPATDIVGALDQACMAGVLVVDSNGYGFRHELHRAAIEETIPADVLHALHLDIARTLAASGAPAMEVAEHFARGAGQGNQAAITWLTKAADEIVEHSPRTALELLDVALRLSGPVPSERVLLARVRALAGTGHMAETEALARSLLREGLDVSTEAQLNRQLAFSYLVQGRSAEAVQAIERYGELISEESLGARTHAEIAFCRFMNLDQAGARLAAELAIDQGRRVGDIAAQVAGGGVLCWLDEFRNKFTVALDQARHILAIAEQPHASEGHLYQPWFIAALVHLEMDMLDDVARDAHRGREVAARTGFAWSMPGYDAMAAYGLMRSGDIDDAAAGSSATLSYLDGVDGFGVALWCHSFLAQIAIHRGDYEVADEHLAIAEAHLTTGRAQFGFEQSMIANARLLEVRGEPQAALDVLGMTWDTYGAIGVLSGRQALGPDLVRLACGAGQQDRAREVEGALREAAVTAETPAFRAYADMASAWIATAPDRAVEAAELMEGTPRRLATAAMWFDTSALTRAAGNNADADAAAGRASALYATCGAHADAARAGQTISMGARRVAKRPKFGWDALTTTETKVVQMISEGLGNRDIADRLFVSRRTVETHVSAAYRKLEVTSRVELARLSLGLTPTRGEARPTTW